MPDRASLMFCAAGNSWNGLSMWLAEAAISCSLRKGLKLGSASHCKIPPRRDSKMRRDTRNISLSAMILCLFAGAAMVSCSLHGGVRPVDQDIPVATVKQSDVQLQVNTTGELRSTRTAAAIAPPVAGDTLQIIHLAKTGVAVKAGEVIVAFDPSEQDTNLGRNRSDFDQGKQKIVKAKTMQQYKL